MIKLKTLTEIESLDYSPYTLPYSYNIVHTASIMILTANVSVTLHHSSAQHDYDFLSSPITALSIRPTI